MFKFSATVKQKQLQRNMTEILGMIKVDFDSAFNLFCVF